MNALLTQIARLLLASIFVISGVRKAMAFGAVSGMMASKGFPIADVALVLTIILEIVGGILLVVNWHAKYAAWALAAFTLAAGTLFHAFWHKWGAPPPEFNNELNHFLKNVAIIGGLLMIAAQSHSRESRI